MSNFLPFDVGIDANSTTAIIYKISQKPNEKLNSSDYSAQYASILT